MNSKKPLNLFSQTLEKQQQKGKITEEASLKLLLGGLLPKTGVAPLSKLNFSDKLLKQDKQTDPFEREQLKDQKGHQRASKPQENQQPTSQIEGKNWAKLAKQEHLIS